MRIKHLLSLKQNQKQPPWTYIATYWLVKDIYNYGQEYHYLKKNNRARTTHQKNPFYYRDLMHYIKTQNPNIPKIKNETKASYKIIIQKGSQEHIISGETVWKNKIQNSDFTKIWKNTYYSHTAKHILCTCYINYYTTQLKQIATFTKLVETKQT